MTPKEKARDLVDKFENYSFMNIDARISSFESAKQCALIAVDEIIKALRKDLPKIGLGKGYWYAVKKEIKTYDTKRKA